MMSQSLLKNLLKKLRKIVKIKIIQRLFKIELKKVKIATLLKEKNSLVYSPTMGIHPL